MKVPPRNTAILGIVMMLVPESLVIARSPTSNRNNRGYHSNSRGGRTSSRYRQDPRVTAMNAYASQMRAAAARAAAVRGANIEVSRAHAALKGSRAILVREFSFSSEYSLAEREVKEAHRALAKARAQAGGDRNDPDVRQAKEQLVSAADYRRSLKRDFEGSVTRDARWTAARKKLEQARIGLAKAHTAGNKTSSSAKRSKSSTRSYRGR